MITDNKEVSKLTELERNSELWKKLEAVLKQRIDLHRKKNDSDQDDSSTAKLRGRIAELKFLLDLASPDPAISTDAGE